MLTTNIAAMRREMREHVEADKLVAGHYWEGGTGCFIGCLTHEDDGSAAPVEKRFGVPQAVTRIGEGIFERLSRLDAAEGRDFALAVTDAIGEDGRDLSRVAWRFLADTLRHLPAQKGDTQAVIDDVIKGMDLLASGKAWPGAAAAATAAATAAAARAADAALAADAAWAAWAAAGSAWAAWAAAGSAAAETRRQRDVFLRLLREA